jgi:predicted Zn-dependent peptidase
MRAAHVCNWYDPDQLKTVDGVTLEDIQSHYKKTFTSDNLRFVLAGAIGNDVQEVVDRLEKWVLPRGERFEYEKLVAQAGGLVCIPKKDMTDIEFQFSIFLNRRLKYQECVALGLLRHALTQTYFSRIYGVARKRGICYAMGSDFETYLPSLSRLDFDGDLSHEHAPELFELIVEEMKRVAIDGITPQELEDAKQFRFGRHQMDIAHSTALAHWYASDYFEDETIDGPDKMIDYINNVTSDMIVALVNEFLDSKLWCLGIIGDTNHNQAQSYYDQLAKLFEER